MKEYNYCCSKDGHGLAFPSFSVVFIQTFSIHGNLEFVLPVDAVLSDYKGVIKKIAECKTVHIDKSVDVAAW